MQLMVCLALVILLGLCEALVSRGTVEDGRGTGTAEVLGQREQGSGEAEGPLGMRIPSQFLYSL